MGNNIRYNLSLCQQRGLSLIELMITIPLGVLVMFAVLQIFTASIQGVNLQNTYSRVQENGRMSMMLMARDIRGADYWGCLHDTSSIINNLDTVDEDYNAIENIVPTNQKGVFGEDNVTSTVIASITVKDYTDTLTLRGAKGFSSLKIIPPYMTLAAAMIHLNANNNSGIKAGDILLIGDCEEAQLFTNTAIDVSSNGTLVFNTGEITVSGAVNNVSKDWLHTYGSSAQITVPYVKTYFIGKNSAESYSLYRSDGGSAKELVRGVNDLQLMYGEDISGDGSADTYSKASAVTNMDDVLSVRLQLVSESGNSASGKSLERTYTVTTNIRNRTL